MSDSPRTDWVWDNTPNEDLARDLFNLSAKLERELAAKERELQQARTMHAEAIEEWAKWEGAAKQARGEALSSVAAFVLKARDALLETPADSQEAYHWLYRIQALVPNYDPYNPWVELERIALKNKPSPASGEQTNADAQDWRNG